MIDRPPRVALRADASAHVGLGHVVRILALGRALIECGAETRLLTRDLGVDTARLAREAGVDHTLLPRDEAAPSAALPLDSGEDARHTIAALLGWLPDVIVIDHYEMGAQWHAAVRSALGSRIAVIDDLADRDLLADWVIDHNPAADHRAKYASRLQNPARILGGPRFALLGPAYRDAPSCVFHETVASIGIFMGGTDAAGYSSIALRACREVAGFAGSVEIAATSANPRLPTLRAECQAWPDTRLLVDAPDLSSFFARHDLQIGAGGGAAWERCRVGAPTLAIACAANQQVVIEPLASLGVIATLPAGVAADASGIGTEVLALLTRPDRRRHISQSGRGLVDGFGARRAALCLLASRLGLRPASAGDARFMHGGRNAPSIRAMSSDHREISWEEHQRWLDNALNDPTRTLLIAQIGPVSVGVIRFDDLPGGMAEVSLYLDPALHGLGLGIALLQTGERYLFLQRGTALRLVATVLEANPASRRTFRQAGYQQTGTRWEKFVPIPPGEPRP